MRKFFHSVLLFLTFVILIFVFLFLYTFLTYRNWEEEFVSNMNSEYLIDEESIEEVELDERLAKFTLSLADTESLRLEVKEVGSVLFTTIDEYLTEGLYLENMYISPSDKTWDIYLKIGNENISVWISFNLNKDDIQTAQLYTTSVKVGPFEVSGYTDLVSMINKGIGEAIVTLNENGFVGRYIENIELLEDAMVLKGSRY